MEAGGIGPSGGWGGTGCLLRVGSGGHAGGRVGPSGGRPFQDSSPAPGQGHRHGRPGPGRIAQARAEQVSGSFGEGSAAGIGRGHLISE